MRVEMRLKCAWGTAAAKADKTDGAPDVDLTEHLRKTEQGHLLQAQILQGCFDTLREKGLLEEAYLRGSIGRGHADEHSDIDLFTVIKPEKINEVYDTVNEFLASKGRIIVGCHDRLVENYGGIGFMFIAESDAHNKQTYQFDLYMAMKGVPPRNPTSIKPRMFAGDPDYKWTDTYGQSAVELPEVTKQFVHKHTSGDSQADRMELLMQEMLITLYVTNKHIKRGQVSRTVVDNHSVVTSAIEFMQVLTGYKSTGYSPVYLGEVVARVAKEIGDREMRQAAEKLERLFDQPMSPVKLLDTLDYSATVFKQAFPERYARKEAEIEFFREQVLLPPVQAYMQQVRQYEQYAAMNKASTSPVNKVSGALRSAFDRFGGFIKGISGDNDNAQPKGPAQPKGKDKKKDIKP